MEINTIGTICRLAYLATIIEQLSNLQQNVRQKNGSALRVQKQLTHHNVPECVHFLLGQVVALQAENHGQQHFAEITE